MSVLTDKLQDIYSKLSSLLPQFKINIKNLSSLSKHIEEMIIGENKMPLWANKSITTVTEDDLSGVTTIGDYAFAHCYSLTSVTIPDSVTTIGGSAFRYCSSLTSVTIPDSVTSIKFAAFHGCSGLTSIIIPESVIDISQQAFYDCDSLTSVIIPGSVTSIGHSSFYSCSNLTDIYLNPTTPPLQVP